MNNQGFKLPDWFTFDPTFMPRSVMDKRRECPTQRISEIKRPKRARHLTFEQMNRMMPAGKEQIITAVTYNIILFNDIMCGQIVQMVAAMKKSPLYKHEIKRLVNDVHDWRVNYERRMKQIVHEDVMRESFMEMCDTYTKNFEPHFRQFFFCVKQALDKRRVTESLPIAWVVTARIAAEMAHRLHVDRMAELERDNARPSWLTLDYLDPKKAFDLLARLESEFNIAETDCPGGQACIDIMQRKLEKVSLISSAIQAGNDLTGVTL